MLKLVKVAVTGGLACGKSSACRFFKELGAYTVSADEIVHQLLSPTTNLGQHVIKLIGSDIVINNRIDRSQIAKKVFNHPSLLKALENLIHPAVRSEMERLYQEVQMSHSAPLFVAEIPLLYETDGQRFFDYTIAVAADDKLCRKRFQQATGNDNIDYEKRMARQLSPVEKAKKADFVILNNGTLEQMKEEVRKIFYMLTKSGTERAR